MRPPMQTAALQQNEGSIRQLHQQQQHLQQSSVVATPTTTVLTHQQTNNKSKLQPRDIFVENHINYACSAAPAATPVKLEAYQKQKQQQHHHFLHNNSHVSLNDDYDDEEDDDDSIQLVDLSTSPPHEAASFVRQHSDILRRIPPPLTQRSSIISDSQLSRSSSSSDDGSLSGDKLLLRYSSSSNSSARAANNFDDAAENFIINFPADSSSLHNQNDCVINLPLSETEPLLTNIEATVADKQRAIRLSKNSASLIFTKKELAPATTNNNCTSLKTTRSNILLRPPSISSSAQQHHSLRLSSSSSSCTFKERQRTTKSKHLPATYHRQQRRSLQLNYNNNLVTTSTCSGANNNYCCNSSLSAATTGGQGTGATLHKHHQQQSGLTSPVAQSQPTTTTAATRKQHAYSWYAPVYSALEEELEQDSRDSSPIHNLANTKKQHSSHYHHRRTSYNITSAAAAVAADNETVALLETRNQINIQAQLHHAQAQTQNNSSTSINSRHLRRSSQAIPQVPNSLALQNPHNAISGAAGSVDFSSVTALNTSYDVVEGPHAGSLGLAGGPLPRRRGFDFIKSLLGLRPSSTGNSSRSSNPISDASTFPPPIVSPVAVSPEITITRTPSEQNVAAVVMRDPAGRCDQKLGNGCGNSIQGSTSSLNVVQQKLWNMMRREGSAASLHQEKSQSIVQYTSGMRKCETVLALTRQTSSLCSPVIGAGPGIVGGGGSITGGSGIFSASGVEQIRPLNRLRNSVTSINAAATCSRCSSLLSLAATGSRYSLNVAAMGGVGFVHTMRTSASQQQLQPAPSSSNQLPHNIYALPLRLPQRLQRNCSTVSHNNINFSINHDDDVAGSNNVPPHNCTRKSSAYSSHSAVSSPSPPSNITTATLNSSTIPQSSISSSDKTTTTPTTISSPTAIKALHLPPSSSAFAASLSHGNYPRTIPPFFSTSAVEDYEQTHDVIDGSSIAASQTLPSTANAQPFQLFTCKLCLVDVESASEATTLLQCGCHFCTECMKAYVEFEISEGAYEISCPDAQCPAQGIITLPETANLTTANLMKKHHRYRLNREIELDKSRTWCPRAGCETVCLVESGPIPDSTAPSTSTATVTSSTGGNDSLTQSLCAVQCPSCKDEFCAACKKTWHPNLSCDEHSRRLIADGQDDIGIPFDNDLIKCCPMCAVPIEKDEGCAQMMCKRCKHVFCWYCLASLDDDFLLRHYDKGPCKNKLGHSRASVVWHRAQVIGIFAGFGILLLVASPLLLLAAPCIICCKCRSCSGSKIDENDADMDEATALQS